MRGDTDEDHFAAVFFNLNGMAYVEGLLHRDTAPQVKKLHIDLTPERHAKAGNPWDVKAPTAFEVARAKARANVRRDESDEPLDSIERDPFNIDGGRY